MMECGGFGALRVEWQVALEGREWSEKEEAGFYAKVKDVNGKILVEDEKVEKLWAEYV